MRSNHRQKDCAICCQKMNPRKIRQHASLVQNICYTCWSSYMKSAIEDTYYYPGDDIDCPVTGKPLDVGLCLETLRTREHKMIDELLMKKYVSMAKDVKRCPNSKCDYVYIDKVCLGWKKCPKCNRQLEGPSRWSARAITMNIYLSFLNRCPQCQLPIQKISGCPHMTCTCKHQFCWECHKDKTYSYYAHRLYTNHCNDECGLILLSKIFLLMICLITVLLNVSKVYTFSWVLSFVPTAAYYVFYSLLVDLVILFNIFAGYLILSSPRPRYRRNKGGYYPQRQRSKSLSEYLLGFGILAFIDFLIIAFILYMESLFFCLTLLLGQVLLAVAIGASAGFIYLVCSGLSKIIR